MDFIDPGLLSITKERKAQVLAGQRLHFTMQLRRADRSTFLAEITTTPLLNSAGRYDGAVALVNDITAQTESKTQAQLRATVLDAVGEAVVATRPDGEIVYINRAAERLLGWRSAEVIGRQHSDVCAQVPDEAEHIHKSVMNGKRHSVTLELFKRDGTQFVAHVTSEPAVDDHETVVGLVTVISDQTERTRLDRNLRTRRLQAETIALLGAQALRQHTDPHIATTPTVTEVVNATRRLLRADRASALDLDATAGELHVRAASPAIDEQIVVPAGSRSFAGYIALAREAVVVDNTEHDRRFDWRDEFGSGPASAIGAPIFGPDGIVGVLLAESSAVVGFDQDDAHFIQGMANIIGTALVGRRSPA
jgi:PAS domain S-box-containing protein